MPGERPLPIGGWVPGPAGDDILTDRTLTDGTPTDNTLTDGTLADAYGGGAPRDSYAGPDTYAGPDAYAGPDEYAHGYRDTYPRYPGPSPSSWDGAPADDIVDPQEPPDPWDAFAPPAAGPPGEAVPRAPRRRDPRPRRRLMTPRIAIAGVAVGVLLVSAGVSARILLGGPDRDEAQPPPVPPDGLVTTPDTGGDLGTATPTPPGPSAPASEPPAVTEVSFEAEAAGVGSHGQVVSVDGASGGDAVKLSGNSAGTFVQFSGIEVGAAGTYRLRIGYFAEQDRTGAVVVNGDQDTAQAVNFPSRAGAGSIGEVVLEVPLAASGNDILVSSTGGAPLFVDGITITSTG